MPDGALQTSMRSPISKGRSIMSSIPAIRAIRLDRVSLAAKPMALHGSSYVFRVTGYELRVTGLPISKFRFL